MSINIESGTVSFNEATSGTITFTLPYTKSPTVVVTSLDNGDDGGNVNCFIDSVTVSSATVRTSSEFTGNIHYHVISRN